MRGANQGERVTEIQYTAMMVLFADHVGAYAYAWANTGCSTPRDGRYMGYHLPSSHLPMVRSKAPARWAAVAPTVYGWLT